MTWTERCRGSICSIAGSMNASVLPDPVRAWPITSRPLRSSGNVGGLDRRRCDDIDPGERLL